MWDWTGGADPHAVFRAHACHPALGLPSILTTELTWMAQVGNDSAFAGSIWMA